MSKKVYQLKSEFERPSNMEAAKIGFGSVNFSRMQVIVLEKIGEGFSNPQIAKSLCLSRRTIESHVFKIKLMLAEYFGYKFCDRELVIFAKNMLDSYKEFISRNYNQMVDKILIEEDIDDLVLANELREKKIQYGFASNDIFASGNPYLDKWSQKDNGF